MGKRLYTVIRATTMKLSCALIAALVLFECAGGRPTEKNNVNCSRRQSAGEVITAQEATIYPPF